MLEKQQGRICTRASLTEQQELSVFCRKMVPGGLRKMGWYLLAYSARSKLRAKLQVTKLTKGRLNSEWFTSGVDGTMNWNWAIQSLDQDNMEWLLHCGLFGWLVDWFFLSSSPASSVLKKLSEWMSRSCPVEAWRTHHLKSWKRSSLIWSLLANQVPFVILLLCSVFRNCDLPVCLCVERMRQREKQLLAVGTKQQELKADRLCLLDDISALQVVTSVCYLLFFFPFGAWVQLRGQVLVAKKFKELLKMRWRGQANGQEGKLSPGSCMLPAQ